MTLKRNFNHSQEIDDNGQNSHAGKPTKVKVTRSGKPFKLVSLTQRLLNITDPKKLEAALNNLTDEQYQQFKKAHEKSAGLAYINNSFHYVKWYHRAYLWLFPMHVSIDCNGKTHSEIRYKTAFGHYFLLHELVKKYE